MDPLTLRNELLFLQEIGFTHLSIASNGIPSPSLPLGAGSARDLGGGVHSIKAARLAEVETRAKACLACRLSNSRTNVVFGVGSADADLMFIGEGPGRDEDLAGEPFVGRAGQLLTDIIKAMKLTRQQVYIANVVKCRPPENRNPELDEMDACRPFLQQQIEIIQPRVIVTLGRFALQSTLQKPIPISSVRGQWLQLGGIKVMPTFHPAYLLRTPAAKKDVWNDMKKVMAELERA